MSKNKFGLVSLTAKLCDGILQPTQDGQWYTNRRWAARTHVCKAVKSTPPLGGTVNQTIFEDLVSSCAGARKGKVLRKLVVRGGCPVVAEKKIVAWIDARYADAFVREYVWAAGSFDPLLVGTSPAWDDVRAVVMPMRDPLTDDEVDLLRSYLTRRSYRAWRAGKAKACLRKFQ